MQPLIDNARLFGQRPREFVPLAEGQSRQVLFITCSDPRVVPTLITGARLGELFDNDPAAKPAVRDWLVHAADEPKCSDTPAPTVTEAVQNHVLTQLERLRAYPCIEKSLEAGELQLHGWYYEVHTGIVPEDHAESGTFEML
jgi:carbonic anhydrase